MERNKLDFDDTQNYFKKSDPTWASLDWVSAQRWDEILDAGAMDDIQSLCRAACSEFILSDKLLTNLCSYGRERLVVNFSTDETQVFRNARLLESNPDEETVLWWDRIKNKGRQNIDLKLLLQGRTAERWTWELELTNTAHLGPNYTPRWLALEADGYGYDILSYRTTSNGQPASVLIEVKSFLSATAPHFYLSRNEWDKALESPTKYLFYVWCIENVQYKIFEPAELLMDVPVNSGRGVWQDVLISLTEWHKK